MSKRIVILLTIGMILVSSCSDNGNDDNDSTDAKNTAKEKTPRLSVELNGIWQVGKGFLKNTYYIISSKGSKGVIEVKAEGKIVCKHEFQVLDEDTILIIGSTRGKYQGENWSTEEFTDVLQLKDPPAELHVSRDPPEGLSPMIDGEIVYLDGFFSSPKILPLPIYHVTKDEVAEMANAKTIDALFIAVMHGDIKRVQSLLASGIDVNAKYTSGTTVLFIAVGLGDTDVIKALIQAKADVNTRCRGHTALMMATGLGNSEVVKILLEADADVNAKLSDGVTALWIAAQNGYTEIVKALLDKGADVNVKRTNGKTALGIAKEKGHTEVVKLLTDYRAKD